MKREKKIAISAASFIVSFILYVFLTGGGLCINYLAHWSLESPIQFVGDFKPDLGFSRDARFRTIIPFVLHKFSFIPENRLSVSKTDGGYESELFEYVRFTKLEVHYHSNNMQDFIFENFAFKERKFRVGKDGHLSVLDRAYHYKLFPLKLDRIEKCTVIIEGYSKLKNEGDEKFFSYTADWFIYEKSSIVTGWEKMGRAA